MARRAAEITRFQNEELSGSAISGVRANGPSHSGGGGAATAAGNDGAVRAPLAN